MTEPYKIVQKRPGLWYIEGPGRGEPNDRFCETDYALIQDMMSMMNYAYYHGRADQRAVVTNALNKLFELGLDR